MKCCTQPRLENWNSLKNSVPSNFAQPYARAWAGTTFFQIFAHNGKKDTSSSGHSLDLYPTSTRFLWCEHKHTDIRTYSTLLCNLQSNLLYTQHYTANTLQYTPQSTLYTLYSIQSTLHNTHSKLLQSTQHCVVNVDSTVETWNNFGDWVTHANHSVSSLLHNTNLHWSNNIIFRHPRPALYYAFTFQFGAAVLTSFSCRNRPV
jgi:hypothetical protein